MKQSEWLKLLIGLAAVFALFQWVASTLGSNCGQAGVTVGLIVTAEVIITERLFFSGHSCRRQKPWDLAGRKRRDCLLPP
jgi:hypothetical protein